MSSTYARPARIQGTGRTVCDIADGLRAAADNWQRELADPAATVQVPRATDAVTAMREAWAANFRAYRAVLERWCTATQAAAAGFATVDDYVASRMRQPGQPSGPQ